LRQRVERASLPLITSISRLPAAVPFLLLLALLVAGVLIDPPVGFVLMGVAALFVAWVLYLSWPTPDRHGTDHAVRRAAARGGHGRHPASFPAADQAADAPARPSSLY
jgi:hypothetical protein